MKCFACNQQIENELHIIHVGDGDFVCNKVCKEKFEKDRNEFFANIHDDNWYETNFFKLK